MKRKLEKSSDIAIQWFKTNYFKLNTDKCKLIVCGHKGPQITVRVGESYIKEEQFVKLLGVHIDNKLNFNDHISKLVKKANSKLYVVKRGLNLLTFHKKKVLLNSFVQSQFSHAPLVWMLCGRDANKKINKVHYNFLKVLYDDYTSTFKQLLDKHKDFTVHQKNIQKLLIEMYKLKYNLEPSLLNDIFTKSNYTGAALRINKDFIRPRINSTKFGIRSLNNIGNIMWNLLPKQIKELASLDEFKSEIKMWKPKKCPCYLCKEFVVGVGIVEICDCHHCQ